MHLADFKLIATALKILVKALIGRDNFGFRCFRILCFLRYHVVYLRKTPPHSGGGGLPGGARRISPALPEAHDQLAYGLCRGNDRPAFPSRRAALVPRYPGRIPRQSGLLDY